MHGLAALPKKAASYDPMPRIVHTAGTRRTRAGRGFGPTAQQVYGEPQGIMSNPLRGRFLAALWRGLLVVWPVLSALLGLMAVLGVAVALLEDWPLTDGLYFAFVSGLTIGYGDLVPKEPLARVLAISIGLTGILLAGLVAAVGVQALQAAVGGRRDE
jgi:hypothetical protein